MFPYNILLNIKSGITPVKSRDSATLFLFNCRRWDCNTYLYVCQLLRMFCILYIVVWRKGNMWVYRYGEISYSSAVSEGTIHAIQGLYVNWREPILWLPALSVLPGIWTGLRHLREIKITINRRNAGFFMSNFIYFYVVRSCILSLYVI